MGKTMTKKSGPVQAKQVQEFAFFTNALGETYCVRGKRDAKHYYTWRDENGSERFDGYKTTAEMVEMLNRAGYRFGGFDR